MTRIAFAALLLGLTIITPAAAEEQRWQIGSTFLIRGTGLDLSTPEGRERLLRRVDRASVKLCRGERPKAALERCVADLRAKALATAPARLKRPLQAALAAREQARLAAR